MEIEIGKTYKVDIDDCCVRGGFTSKLTNAQAYGDNDVLQNVTATDYGTSVHFENGVQLSMDGGVTLTEVSVGLKS